MSFLRKWIPFPVSSVAKENKIKKNNVRDEADGDFPKGHDLLCSSQVWGSRRGLGRPGRSPSEEQLSSQRLPRGPPPDLRITLQCDLMSPTIEGVNFYLFLVGPRLPLTEAAASAGPRGAGAGATGREGLPQNSSHSASLAAGLIESRSGTGLVVPEAGIALG